MKWMPWFVLLVLFGLMKGFGALGLDAASNAGHHAAIAFGFLILLGSLSGEAAKRVGLPAITGYMLAGLACGPDLLGVLDAQVIEMLQSIDELALFFIAMTAGAELHWDDLRSRLRLLLGLAFAQLLIGLLLVTASVLLLSPWIPFLSELPLQGRAAAAVVLAMISVATSPATVVAVIVETRARGSFRDIILGTTVVMDVLVLVAFALVLSLVGPHLGSQVQSGPLSELLHIFLGMSVGAFVGFLFILYQRRVGRGLHLVILASSLFLVRVSHDLHLDALMLALVVGFVISNRSNQGRAFLEHLESAAQPIFLVFFGLAGAALKLSVLLQVWPLALLFVLMRFVSKALAVSGVSHLLGGGENLSRYGAFGFIGQAGVSLGFAAIVAERFPEVGGALREVVLAAVVLNQIAGPVLFKYALMKAGALTDKT
jgi:Kef-type K+ transport system membrane component KefB